jgi:hypothetical protein
MGKYEPLGDYLRRQGVDRVTLSFDDISDIIGDALPASARQHAEWWANDATGGHVQANAWLAEGWRAEPASLSDERIAFVRGN